MNPKYEDFVTVSVEKDRLIDTNVPEIVLEKEVCHSTLPVVGHLFQSVQGSFETEAI